MKNTYGDAETEETTLQKKVNELVQARNELEAMKTVCEGLKQLIGTKEDATSLYFENQILRAELEIEKAKSAEVVSVLNMILQIENNSGWGLNDLADDSGQPYQSAHFSAILSKAEMIVSQKSTIPDPLYSSAPEMLIALERCEPYMNDLEGENFEDSSAGIFQDKELSLAVETLRFAIKKAKGEPYP